MERGTSRPAQAAALVLGGLALSGLIDNFLRLAVETGSLWGFPVLRWVLALLLLVVLAGQGLRRPSRVLLRSLLNSLAMVIYFGCQGLMPIAQVVARLFTAPLFVVLFSVALFGEKVGPWRVFAVVLGFAGILLALGLNAEDLTGWTLSPVLAGASYGLGNLVTREWCAGEGTAAMLGGFFGTMLIGGRWAAWSCDSAPCWCPRAPRAGRRRAGAWRMACSSP